MLLVGHQQIENSVRPDAYDFERFYSQVVKQQQIEDRTSLSTKYTQACFDTTTQRRSSQAEARGSVMMQETRGKISALNMSGIDPVSSRPFIRGEGTIGY